MKDLKQKVFGMHMGCEVAGTFQDEQCIGYLTGIREGNEAEIQWVFKGNAEEEPDYKSFDEVSLLLKPLSMITDEHAIEVAKMCGMAKAVVSARTPDFVVLIDDTYALYINYNGYVYMTKNDRMYHQNTSKCIDFFRSNGYATPCFGHSVDSLISQGIFKLKEA